MNTTSQTGSVATECAARVTDAGNAPRAYVEHQAIEVAGRDGKTHQLWARTAKEAYQDATKWSYRHGGLDDVRLLILQDDNEGCWDRARRVQFGRLSSDKLFCLGNI